MTGRTAQLAAVLGVAALAVMLALYLQRMQMPPGVEPSPTLAARPASPTATPTVAPTASPQPTPTAQPRTSPPATTTTAAQPGAISGRLGYPSEFIPPVTVYAISTADRRVWHSVDVPRFPPASGASSPAPEPVYTIRGVAPGTYHVLAYRNDRERPDPGLYSRYAAECRPGAPPAACADHSLFPVTVRPGATTTGIDVTDWIYGAPGQPSPSIPPRPTPR